MAEITSLSEFQDHPREVIDRVKETKAPYFLTVNSKAEVVVQDAIAYQELLDRLEHAEAVAAIREGLADFERGECRPAREALEELRNKHGIPR